MYKIKEFQVLRFMCKYFNLEGCYKIAEKFNTWGLGGELYKPPSWIE